MRAKPSAAKRSISARLAAVGTKAGSCCSPSRAKHSHRVTARVPSFIVDIINYPALGCQRCTP